MGGRGGGGASGIGSGINPGYFFGGLPVLDGLNYTYWAAALAFVAPAGPNVYPIPGQGGSGYRVPAVTTISWSSLVAFDGQATQYSKGGDHGTGSFGGSGLGGPGGGGGASEYYDFGGLGVAQKTGGNGGAMGFTGAVGSPGITGGGGGGGSAPGASIGFGGRAGGVGGNGVIELEYEVG
jgi:hypothetical protein